LRGNGGADLFLVRADGLNSPVVIDGGAPTTAPGDSLRLILDRERTPEFVPSGPGAGQYTFAPTVSVEYTGLENALATYPGDFNLDGVVDGADRALYVAGYGTTVSPPGTGADANGDGMVNAADGILLRNYMGARYLPAGSGSGAALTSLASAAAIDASLEANLEGDDAERSYVDDLAMQHAFHDAVGPLRRMRPAARRDPFQFDPADRAHTDLLLMLAADRSDAPTVPTGHFKGVEEFELATDGRGIQPFPEELWELIGA
jgi:hypothetical protein